MKKILYQSGKILVIILAVFMCCGCAVKFQQRHSQDIREIEKLSQELKEMNRTMALLKDKLKEEISRGEVSVEKEKRGIVVTFVAEVLFDSGKAEIRNEGVSALDKTASVLKRVDNDISVEGHTDNIPIKYSGWKSNWELSTARALSVLHYLVEEEGLNPQKVSATGYGEYRPVAANTNTEGRQKNRRVEIIIKPRLVKDFTKQTKLNVK